MAKAVEKPENKATTRWIVAACIRFVFVCSCCKEQFKFAINKKKGKTIIPHRLLKL